LDAAWLGRILETLPGFVLLVDPQGTIRYINRVEPGFEPNEVVGTEARAFLFAESGAVFADVLAAVLEKGREEQFDVEVPLPDGTRAWYRSEMHPLLEDGEVVGVVIVGSNVSALKAAQEAVARMRKLLPICAWCDRIRREDGDWETIEAYVKRVGDVDVTHGLCPACEQRMVEGDDPTTGRVA
jgi:PAS domain S-box-containing protein